MTDLERQYSGEDFVIESPGKVKDVDGDDREFDCVVRSAKSPFAVVEVFECRDRRSGSNDITWVDQVHGKFCDLLHQPKVTLVHRLRLTKKAIKKAARLGFEVRRLAESTLEERAKAVGVAVGQIRNLNWSVAYLAIEAIPMENCVDRDRELLKSIDSNYLRHFPCFFDAEYLEFRSLQQIFDQELEEHLASLNTEEIEFIHQFTVSWPSGSQLAIPGSGTMPISSVIVTVFVQREESVYRNKEMSTYASSEWKGSKDVDQLVFERGGRISTAVGLWSVSVDEHGRTIANFDAFLTEDNLRVQLDFIEVEPLRRRCSLEAKRQEDGMLDLD